MITERENIEKYYKDFPITSVCRADLESAGFDTTNVDDDTMLELATRMSYAYSSFGFWEDMKTFAKHFQIRKHDQK